MHTALPDPIETEAKALLMASCGRLFPWTPWLIAGVGVLALCVPTLWDLINGLWMSDAQGHGPIVLAISCWLLWRRWPDMQAAPSAPMPALGWTVLLLSLAFYVLGRSQSIASMEVLSIILTLISVVLLLHGRFALKLIWFPLFFMLFMVPLPAPLVDALTQPMKLAVSFVAELVLGAAGYPISRSGVILQVGQYQLLVADACAGLHTLFTLEALGLLYLNLIKHHSVARNVALGILIVPISFSANVIRVMVLSLITYHFGDEAGQGFLHGFAGMVLFLVALMLIVGVDSLLRVAVKFFHANEPSPA
jgi:exosortase B